MLERIRKSIKIFFRNLSQNLGNFALCPKKPWLVGRNGFVCLNRTLKKFLGGLIRKTYTFFLTSTTL